MCYHLLLAGGALVFSLPFAWLLSSSFKDHDELFSETWLPSLPAAVSSSPYLAPAESHLERPERIAPQAWKTLEPRLLQQLSERLAQVDHPGVQAAMRQEPEVLPALAVEAARVLFKRGGGSLFAERSPEEAIASLCQQVDRELLDHVLNRTYRGVLIGELLAEFADGRQQVLLGRDAQPRAQSAGLDLGEVLTFQERPGRQVRLQFANDQGLNATFALPSPLSVGQLRRLVLPIRGDRSYHELVLILDTGEGVYRARAPFVLENDRWMDALWAFAEPSLREQRTVYYSAHLTPLDRLGPSSGTPSLTLEFTRTAYPVVLARHFLKNYAGALLAVPFLTYLRNTVLLTLLNILAQLFSCTLIAYGFARLRWPGRDGVFALVLSTLMLPPQVTMIPQFLIWRSLGQYDTFQPLWVPSLFGAGFFIFMMRQFMLTIPKDLEEAARIDGCGYWGTYWRIILPLLKPALAAVCIFQFMGTWNDFLGPLIYLSSASRAPLSLGLFRFQSSHFVSAVGEWGLLMAASALMVLPVILLFFCAQRYFIQGITLTGMKN